MNYYIFKASSKDGKIVKEYLYNEAVTNKFNVKDMMTFVKNFIRDDLKKEGLNIKDFTFTKRLQSYKDFKSNYNNLKFINNRTFTEIEAVPEDMKQSDKNKEENQERMKKIRNKSTARLPKSKYGAWSTPRDPNFKFQ